MNYKEAFKLLTDRFGREEELMKLQPVFHDKDITWIRKLYDNVDTHHRALKALGKAQDQYSDMFVPLTESKLPENLQVSLLKEKSGSWKVDEMLDILGKEQAEIRVCGGKGAQEIKEPEHHKCFVHDER